MGRPQQPRARQAHTKNGFAPKTCPVCGRPFEWRRAWQRDWEQVIYCSERCRRSRSRGPDEGEGEAEAGVRPR